MAPRIIGTAVLLLVAACSEVEEAQRRNEQAEVKRIMREAEKEGDRMMKDIEKEVARDAEEQYRIAKKSGSPMDVCIQAKSVSAGWLQAKHEANYAKWKKIEKADCKAAGFDE